MLSHLQWIQCRLFIPLFTMGQRLSSSAMAAANILHDIDVPVKKATFGMGCFWGPDTLYGTLKGVIRTRVGYSGGTKINPTYRDLGDHTECIDIDYDPNEISFEKLLEEFWKNHDPTYRATKQYTSLIFYHDDDQKQTAEKSFKEEEEKKGKKGKFVTKILPAAEFYNAEDYHQKYRLQQHTQLVRWLGLTAGKKLISSHAAARINGYVVGMGGVQMFEEDISRLGLTPEIADYVRKWVTKYEGHGMIC
ncbi:peptide methionine sulfoxide reductase isoform X1 [Schistocerca serialis cubense]|uniref:peptide methionine sulfoxide reductase isoform X1 n=2 Tax=Schistocerca serialis cubense TaxID=2023355 RepID=UPI00214E0708|nr:peptide methionine sulfoxide reductase isoform X1 [Schistocerca serialis cubense]